MRSISKTMLASYLLSGLILTSGPALVMGAECPAEFVFTGEAFQDLFGTSVSGAGDVNGDGIDDFIVGAQFNDLGGDKAGRAYVYSGQNGALLYTFTGEADGDHFGISVSEAGDVNGDGFADLIVGAALRANDSGKAYVYSGQTGELLYSFYGDERSFDRFGISVSGAGDVDMDGFDDMIVGARRAGNNSQGRAFVYSGQTGVLIHVFTGVANDDAFGSSVSGAGDVNGDGFADLIVGAFQNDSGGNRAGQAYVYSGQNGALLHTFTGEAAGDIFGFSVSGNVDINSDGFADLIIGAHFSDFGAGRVYVYSGATGQQIHLLLAESAGDGFGSSVSGTEDVNGDGVDDIIVGAPSNDAGGTSAGRVYVYSGLTGLLLQEFTGVAPGDVFGASVSGVGDINSDGFADLIVGANDGNAGRAHVYLLGDNDEDGIISSLDNCPCIFNPGQEDLDNDGRGDACFLPNYLTPLVIVVSDTTAGVDPEINVTVIDPEGLSIGADSLDFIANSIGDSAAYFQIDGNDSIVINDPKTGEYKILVLSEAGSSNEGELYTISIRTDGTVEVKFGAIAKPEPGVVDTTTYETIPYVFGDANGDMVVNIADVTFLIARIFSGGQPPPVAEAADANCDGLVNIADVTFLIARIFSGGTAPGCG